MANQNGRKKSNRAPPCEFTPEAFREHFDEELPRLLDLATWRCGRDLDAEYARIETEVLHAAQVESEMEGYIREQVHPLLGQAQDAPPGAGLHVVTPDDVRAVHQGILFNGAVEVCDGTCQLHRTLAMTIYHLGVSRISYSGNSGTWNTQLFHRDLRRRGDDPKEAVLAFLRNRNRRSLHEDTGDAMTELARRGLVAFAERVILARNCTAPWRMGHGPLAPLEMICAYFTDVAIESIKIVRELVEHERFVFVSSEPDDGALLTLGQGLRPLEYLIVGTMRERIEKALELWVPRHQPSVDLTWDGEQLTPSQWMIRFRDEVAPRVVYGLYRATALAPPQLFYAHEKHAAVAARIAIADSVFLEQRGFPLLIDLADRVCKLVYGGGSMQSMAESAYASAGVPFRYGSERQTREDW